MKTAILSTYFGVKTAPSAVGLHTHDYWQMEIVTQGAIDAGLQGEAFVLETGDILLIPPGWEHEFAYRLPGVAWITLKFERGEDDGPLWGGIIRGNQTTGRLIASFRAAIRGSAYKPYEKAFVHGFLETMFQYIRSDDFHASDDDKSDRLVRQITEKVLTRNGKAVTVNELAEQLSYTRSHLSKRFKDITGESLKAYIDKIRIRKIEELLRYREHSLSEIAADLGFHDLFSFSRFFKKHTGESPRAYQKKTDRPAGTASADNSSGSISGSSRGISSDPT